MRRVRRGLIGAAVALTLSAPPSAMGQAANAPSMLSNAPLARPMPGDANSSFSRDPVFPLGPLPGDLQGGQPAAEPREVRKIAIVPGATPAVPAPAPAIGPIPAGVQARADDAPAPAGRRRSVSRPAAGPALPAAAAQPGSPVAANEVVAREVVVRPSPSPPALVVRTPPAAVIVAEPPPTFVQPLSPTGSGSWYFYDQPTERGSPGRR